MSFGDHQGEANNGKVGHQKFMIDPNTSPHPLFLVKAMKLSFVVNLIKLVKSDSWRKKLLIYTEALCMHYIYIYIYIYIEKDKECALQIIIIINSLLMQQWLYGNSCICPNGLQLHITDTNEPKSAQQVKQEGA